MRQTDQKTKLYKAYMGKFPAPPGQFEQNQPPDEAQKTAGHAQRQHWQTARGVEQVEVMDV